MRDERSECRGCHDNPCVPQAYIWHKTGDEILDNLASSCQRITNSVTEQNCPEGSTWSERRQAFGQRCTVLLGESWSLPYSRL